MVLKFVGFLACGFHLTFLQGEDSVVKDLTESIVVEFASWHLCIFALGVKVILHLLEHAFLVAGAHSLFKLRGVFLLLRFLVRVEFQFVVEVARFGLLPIAVLEFGLDLLQMG